MTTNHVNNAPHNPALQRRSVQPQDGNSFPASEDSLVISLSSVGDMFPQWGTNFRRRDIELRKFWPTEPILASALFSTIGRNSAFSWSLEGPAETVNMVQHILNSADFGRGWGSFVSKVYTDVMTQDNGGWIEIIRAEDRPDSPAIGLAHLDAARITRTGDLEEPAIFQDLKGVFHRMKWYQVQDMTDFPSPVAQMRGMQLCAVSRVLRAAQILRAIGVYQNEKISGDNPNAIHLVGGITSNTITTALEQHKAKQAERGMAVFTIPAVIASLDPTATISVETLDLKTLPDGFNIEENMKWYISQLALGMGADYQDFAPLPGGNLGSSAQSLVLHQKSRGRGPALFMTAFEKLMNFHGVIPSGVTFQFDETDVVEETEQATLLKTESQAYKDLVDTGALDDQAIRQLLLDNGRISQETFDRLSEGKDLTTDITAQDTEPVEGKARHLSTRPRRKKKPKKGEPGYEGDKQVEPSDVENLADFGEDIRDELTATMENELNVAFKDLLGDFEQFIGFKDTKVWWPKAQLRGRKQEPPGDIFTSDAFWAGFRSQLIPIGMSSARDGVIDAGQFNLDLGLAVDMDLVNQQALEFSRRYATTWIDALEESTRNQMRGAITAWQETGLGTQGFPDLVKALETSFSPVRAKRIATTEITRIFDEGNRIAHNQAGITIQEWQTARDALVDDVCSELDDERFPTNSGPRPPIHVN